MRLVIVFVLSFILAFSALGWTGPTVSGLIVDTKGCYKYNWLLFGFVILGISSLFLKENKPSRVIS